MKKFLSVFVLIILFAAAALADPPLRDFSVVLNGGISSVYAGANVAITITANCIDGTPKTDFTGTVGITASVGNVFIQADGNTLTQVIFTSERWTGFIQLLGAAAPLTITCVDFASGATGTALKTVTPNIYKKPLVIMDGMTWAPGTVGAGFTGWPVTQTTTSPFFVTVLAVDAWNNTINTLFPTLDLETTSSGWVVTPTTVDMSIDGKANTIFAVTLFPNPDSSGEYDITATDINSPAKHDTAKPFFASLTDFFIWAEGPPSAVAGRNFTVTVIVSHFSPTSGVPIPGFGFLGDNVQIAAIDAGGNSLNPGLLPVKEPIGLFTDGVCTFTVNYQRSSPNDVTGIRISPKYIGTLNMNNGIMDSRNSYDIVIYADAPSSFTYTADRVKLKKNENSVLSVKISDQYSNPVSNTAVDFTVTTGSGILSDGLGNTWAARSVNTNLYGYAFITVTAQSNTITSISAAVAGIAGTQTKEIEFADIIDNNKVRNFPNPFNPLQGPTTIEYYLDDDSAVTMKLYSFSGSLVWNKEIPAGVMGGRKGYNPYVWDGMTDRHMPVGVGLYTLKIEVKANKGKYTLTRKIAVKK
jgi:hypothetical protein